MVINMEKWVEDEDFQVPWKNSKHYRSELAGYGLVGTGRSSYGWFGYMDIFRCSRSSDVGPLVDPGSLYFNSCLYEDRLLEDYILYWNNWLLWYPDTFPIQFPRMPLTRIQFHE